MLRRYEYGWLRAVLLTIHIVVASIIFIIGKSNIIAFNLFQQLSVQLSSITAAPSGSSIMYISCLVLGIRPSPLAG